MREHWRTLDCRMFDFAPFYQRIAEQMPDGARLVEVGNADGASAIYLAEALLNRGKEFQLYLVDSLAYGGQDQFWTLIKNVSAADLFRWVEFYPFDSLNASCRFPDHHFDFVFIDASHRYELTKADIRLWYRKIKDGGVLAGHDYNDDAGLEVKRAVDELIPARVMVDDVLGATEPLLRTEWTEKELGVWWLEKKAYAKID